MGIQYSVGSYIGTSVKLDDSIAANLLEIWEDSMEFSQLTEVGNITALMINWNYGPRELVISHSDSLVYIDLNEGGATPTPFSPLNSDFIKIVESLLADWQVVPQEPLIFAPGVFIDVM